MGNKWRQEGCLSCWEASLWNCLGVVRSQVGGLDRGLLNLSLLTLGGGTLSSLPPNYGCVGRCWWWCHILLRFSLKKKKSNQQPTKQKLSTSQICPLRKGSKAVLYHGHWCCCCHLDVGLVVLVVGGEKKLSRGSFHAIPFLLQLFQMFQLPARQSQNVSAQKQNEHVF